MKHSQRAKRVCALGFAVFYLGCTEVKESGREVLCPHEIACARCSIVDGFTVRCDCLRPLILSESQTCPRKNPPYKDVCGHEYDFESMVAPDAQVTLLQDSGDSRSDGSFAKSGSQP